MEFILWKLISIFVLGFFIHLTRCGVMENGPAKGERKSLDGLMESLLGRMQRDAASKPKKRLTLMELLALDPYKNYFNILKQSWKGPSSDARRPFATYFTLFSKYLRKDSATPVKQDCKTGWEKIMDNCYVFNMTLSTWYEANGDCTFHGARLLSIGSSEERSLILKKIIPKIKSREHMTWWVGLVLKNHQSREWVWLDQTPLDRTITPFARGEPNNKAGNENCVELSMQGKMNDKECTRENPFICEISKEREHKSSLVASASNNKPHTKHFTLTTHSTGQPNIVATANLQHNKLVAGADHVGDRQREDEYKYIPQEESIKVDNINKFTGASKEDKNSGEKRTTEGPTKRTSHRPGRVTIDNFTKKPKKDDDDSDESGNGEHTTTKKHGGNNNDKTKKPPKTSTEHPREDKTKVNNRTISEYSTTTPSTFINIIDFELHEDCYGDKSLYEEETKDKDVEKKKGVEKETKKQSSFCPKVEYGNITFPKTRFGATARMPCGKGGASKASWVCDEVHKCWLAEPNTNECVNKELQGILDKVGGKLNEKDVMDITEQLADVVNNQTELSAEDILFTSKLMKSLAKVASRVATNETAVKKVVKNLAHIGNGILKNKKSQSTQSMSAASKNQAATSVLQAMESSTASIVEALNKPATITIEEDNVDIKIKVMMVDELSDEGFVIGEKDENSVQIPKETLQSNSDGGLAKAVVMVFEEVSRFLQPENSEDESENKQFVSSKVVSASLGERKVYNLSNPVILNFTHTKNKLPNSDMNCSFLVVSPRTGSSQWSQEGCTLVKTDEDHTTCSCNHLTNFAVLMDVHGVKLTEQHRLVLEYITYIGCTISIICLVASWFTFMCLTSLQGERNSIHKNLVFCLLIAEILFLAGINKTDNRVGCAVIAGFLHYLFLAVFMWMYLEGLHIIFMIVQVFDSSKSRLPFYYGAGYGIPAVIVAISAAVYSDGYGTAAHCWLSTERYFIWSFAGPVAVILLVNMIVLIYAMSMVCKQSDYVFGAKTSSGRMRSWIQGAVAMEVLLGLTWILGYLFISGETLVFAYIFSILNSLQGLFIFVYHCILSKKVRNEYMKILEASSMSTRSTSGNTKTQTATKKASIPNGSLDASHIDTPL